MVQSKRISRMKAKPPRNLTKKPPKAHIDYAKKKIRQTFDGSQVQDHTLSFPHFSLEELRLGKVLGKGGFGTVSEVVSFGLSDEAAVSELLSKRFESSSMEVPKEQAAAEESEGGNSNEKSNLQESRKFISEHCLRKPSNEARYAVKMLSPEVVEDPGNFLQGMIDMEMECRFLSDIEHPNIIKLRAIAAKEDDPANFFIVMDRLYDTLEGRLNKWQAKATRFSGMARRLSDPKGIKAAALYEERIVVAFDLAAAVEYMHDRKIIYRDLKPENIGFDVRDDVKIFDFGLAKELKDDLSNGDGTYKLTGMTGSMRYMAPEVANALPYNEKCDAYSFAILLWQMMALKDPYELYTPKSLREKVYNGACKRPPLDESWNPAVKICLKRSWTHEFENRNSVKQIVLILRKECVRCRDGNETGLEHHTRRSTFVFRQ